MFRASSPRCEPCSPMGASMRKAFGWIVAIVVVATAIAIYYGYYKQEPVPPPTPAPVAQAPQEPAEPAIRHPIPEEAAKSLLRTDGFIRRIVATVDDLPRRKVAVRVRPVQLAPGQFQIDKTGDGRTISADNPARYAAYVRLAKQIDAEKVVGLYVRFYPLFQQAYEALGYPGSYFNDRLIHVIDHLLEAPDIPAKARLVQPKVFYEFEDPELEGRSAGEKIMMRIGTENA